MNFTVTLPPNTQNHGNPGLICLPPIWTDYILFFATNYFAHAATLIKQPGESLGETLQSTANALFIPGSGALRAFRFLVLYISPLLLRLRRDGFDDKSRPVSALDQAARAGALCMVVDEETIIRAYKMKRPSQYIFGDDIKIVPFSRAIHGVCDFSGLRPGDPQYFLVEVPPNMPLDIYRPPTPRSSHSGSSDTSHLERLETAPQELFLARNYNIPKILISILQALWGVSTLVKSRGDQIALYGYGAFGLTVAPYAIMSIINLATNLLRPEYMTMYLVHSPEMDDALRYGARFWGIVGQATPVEENDSQKNDGQKNDGQTLDSKTFFTLNMLGYLVICILPIALVGGFTDFQAGENVTIAISWVLGWIIIGSVSSLWVRAISSSFWLPPIWEVILVTPLWIPAIGGFVVVAQMLNDFGICTEFEQQR